MARSVLGLALWLLGATRILAIDFSRYHSQEEINDYLRTLAREHAEFVRFHHLGYSQLGREINYVVIGRQGGEAPAAFYVNGTHHGDEKSSTEATLGLIDFLVRHRGQADIAPLLENYAVYAQPLVNPDGHAAHLRTDAQGLDPNRDYAFAERSEQASFTIPPTRLVKSLTDKVRFRAAVAFHSGMEAVLWPSCHSPQRAADHDVFFTLAKAAAMAMGFTRYLQSYLDYPTRGEFIDYAYMAHGTLAVTVEVSDEPTPPPSRLAPVVRKSIAGALAFMLSVMDLDQGRLAIERAPDSSGHSPPSQMARVSRE